MLCAENCLINKIERCSKVTHKAGVISYAALHAFSLTSAVYRFFLHLFAQGIDADVALFMNKSLFTVSASTIKKLSNKLEPEPATFPHESKTYSWASS